MNKQDPYLVLLWNIEEHIDNPEKNVFELAKKMPEGTRLEYYVDADFDEDEKQWYSYALLYVILPFVCEKSESLVKEYTRIRVDEVDRSCLRYSLGSVEDQFEYNFNIEI